MLRSQPSRDATSGEDYLSPEERNKRARAKREQAIERGLTPDWFHRRGDLCIPAGFRVAVIGAGFAGLSAACYLTDCGVKNTVYEATGLVGGRVRTSHTFVSPKIVEDGAELIGENHPLWGLHAQRFRLTLTELTDDEAAGLDVRTRFAGRDLTKAEKARLDADLVKRFLAFGVEASAVHELHPWQSRDAGKLDAISIGAKLDSLMGKTPTLERMWFDFTLGNDNCAPVGRQSYLGLLASISASRMGSDAKGMMGYWYSTETHRCAGGNDLLAKHLSKRLKDLRLLHVVRLIRIDPALTRPVSIFSAEFDAAGKLKHVRREHFDMAILTAPPTVWNTMAFEPALQPASRTLQHGPAVKYMSRYDTRFWEKTRTAPTAKWDELGSVWEGTDNQGTAAPFDLTVFSGGDFVLPASEYPVRLAKLYPPAKPPDGVPTGQQFIDWPNEPYVKTGYAVPGVGQVTGVFPNQLVPHAKYLYFAGEQTSPGFFGYMEGALQSGARAARDILLRVAQPCQYAEAGSGYQGGGGRTGGGGSTDSY